MTEVLPYRSPHERFRQTASLGMFIFLGSWAMLFAGLFFAYGAVRSHAVEWPPPGAPVLPRLLPGINTAVLLASSASLQWWIRASERRRPVAFAALLTLSLGLVFAGLQLWLWRIIYLEGLTPDAGVYPSVFWALTLFHGLHLLIGLFALAALSYRSVRGWTMAARPLPLRLWGMYWHFVDVVWVAIFLTVFF